VCVGGGGRGDRKMIRRFVYRWNRCLMGVSLTPRILNLILIMFILCIHKEDLLYFFLFIIFSLKPPLEYIVSNLMHLLYVPFDQV
jgi:hypothetical protein